MIDWAGVTLEDVALLVQQQLEGSHSASFTTDWLLKGSQRNLTECRGVRLFQSAREHGWTASRDASSAFFDGTDEGGNEACGIEVAAVGDVPAIFPGNVKQFEQRR